MDENINQKISPFEIAMSTPHAAAGTESKSVYA